jgi:UDP-N-acetylglucosamine 2-epimerase (non-hydrolysing)
MAEIHFAPTPFAKNALLTEGVPANKIVTTGNTVVDALQYISKIPFSFKRTPLKVIDLDHHRIVLVTSHRRESWGQDFENICTALKIIVRKHPDVMIIFPVHPNPIVRDSAHKILAEQERIYLIAPLDYLPFINLMKKANIILTDSGGLQEEAPTLRKPLLVMRDVTERPEAVNAGLSRLIGTTTKNIVKEVSILLNDEHVYHTMTNGENPYGDGKAAQRIVQTLMRWAAGKKILCPSGEEFNPRVNPSS